MFSRRFIRHDQQMNRMPRQPIPVDGRKLFTVNVFRQLGLGGRGAPVFDAPRQTVPVDRIDQDRIVSQLHGLGLPNPQHRAEYGHWHQPQSEYDLSPNKINTPSVKTRARFLQRFETPRCVRFEYPIGLVSKTHHSNRTKHKTVFFELSNWGKQNSSCYINNNSRKNV